MGYHLNVCMDDFSRHQSCRIPARSAMDHGNGISSADGQKLNIDGVGITAKIHQVCINIGIMTTLEIDYMHQSG